MERPRTLVLAVDGLDAADQDRLRAEPRAAGRPVLRELLSPGTGQVLLAPGGPSEAAPALTSLVTGASVARTGIATARPFSLPTARGATETPASAAWYARDLRVPTLLDGARAAGRTTAALGWPATAGGSADWCLPLVEDPQHYANRWEMAERTSSRRMVAAHLAPRRAAGVRLSQAPSDALIAEIGAELLRSAPPEITLVHLDGLGRERRARGLGGAGDRALEDAADAAEQLLAAFAPRDRDCVVLVPGRPLGPTTLLVHPNAELAARGLIRTDGPRIAEARAAVWPDGGRGVLHVARSEGEAVRRLALDVLGALVEQVEQVEHPGISLRTVADGVGATPTTDVLAVLEGEPGTVFGLSATHRLLVDGSDPYSSGPLAVADPAATGTVRLRGPGLPTEGSGSWADLGVSLARTLGLALPGATAAGVRTLRARVS